MNLRFKLIQKAAAHTAAFCFLFAVGPALAKQKSADIELETVKKKVVNLLIQRQKKQALSVLGDYIALDANRAGVRLVRDTPGRPRTPRRRP